MTTDKTEFKKMRTLAETFVDSHRGRWEHDDWEKLLANARKAGLDVDDNEVRRKLGDLLERGKRNFGSIARNDAKRELP